MRMPTLLTAMLIGSLSAQVSAIGQGQAQKTTKAEPAKNEDLRDKARLIPLQSLVQIKHADGRTYKGRLSEVSTAGLSLQVMLDTGVDTRQIPYDQLRSIRVDYETEEQSSLGVIRGLFRAPSGSLIELRLSNGERVKGVIEEFLRNAVLFRIRNKDHSLETRTIPFGQLGMFSVKAVAALGVSSDPEAFKLVSGSAVASTSEVTDSPPTRLPEDTPVVVRLRNTISTADVQLGDRVDLEIVEEVKVGEHLILPKGGAAWGKVTEVVPKRRMGRGARLSIEISEARTFAGGTLALRSTKGAARGGRSSNMVGAMIGAGIFAAPLPGITAPMLLMHGSETAIPKGTWMVAYVAGEKRTP